MIKVLSYLMSAILFLLPLVGMSQQDTLIQKLDSLTQQADSAGGQVNNINAQTYNAYTSLTPASYLKLLGSDLKQQFTKPFHMKKKDWGNLGKFALVAGALAFADRPIQRNVAPIITKNRGIAKVSGFITDFGGIYEAYTLAALGTYGLIAKNQKIQTTTLLATQAFITGGSLERVVKFLSGRTRPAFYATGEEPRPRFLGPFAKAARDAPGGRLYGSFPSGHTTVAFAAATVFALEYRNKPIVPVIAYSAASLIGLSRIFENKHWATDVLAGAAIGFLAGRNVVNNYHRFAKLKSPKSKTKTSMLININYFNNQLVPGIVCRF
ncbi:phosphatase PAP2 family protein [Segetibacter sp. 3557_3]|uniref:phosphatase PAP2 family protein n=1 Tax=Segetibacter sp. 3557_3 TaxID=2547429 RepID=UPI001058641B|nr:phosphatase PAP2 family protein [Segetibacter sp. 3557_3]TDH21399.1 phosphatase PAP2 family protein [Segetibacter sp. 3557_3]